METDRICLESGCYYIFTTFNSDVIIDTDTNVIEYMNTKRMPSQIRMSTQFDLECILLNSTWMNKILILNLSIIKVK